MAKKNNWNTDAMQGTLISDMEQEVKEGVSQMQPLEPVREITEHQEPTKGVQTYIRMSDYQRLYNQKMKRDMENGMMNSKMKTTIAILAAEAISLWLDVQEGKSVVTKK